MYIANLQSTLPQKNLFPACHKISGMPGFKNMVVCGFHQQMKTPVLNLLYTLILRLGWSSK